ncbi:ribosome biogenesis GTPase Der [Candidatus Providencia siddallii]|uniref:GTPase Der n=1 Tax=Candidatus Providencia siddallii TaxID=1715285 RepID=A0ABM9NP99_9GAMM
MIPILALIGRSNVGKSTLFNWITRTKDAIVSDYYGVTRDRKYGNFTLKGKKITVIDTCGIDNIKNIKNNEIIQSFLAIEEANIIFFVVDAKEGLTSTDKDIAKYLHKTKKKIYLLINKVNNNIIIDNFYTLGISDMYYINSDKKSLFELIKFCFMYFFKLKNQQVLLNLKKEYHRIKKYKKNNKDIISYIKIAIVGKPNVGKSTLINYILKENRVITSDIPGTTRDSIYIQTNYKKQNYILIDTAGVRKRTKITGIIEKFSVSQTLKSIKNANVVLMLIDACLGVSNQDLLLSNFILKSGRSLIIVVNKSDKIKSLNFNLIKNNFYSRFSFIDFIRIHFVSALSGKGIDDLFLSINETYSLYNSNYKTSLLTRILKKAEEKHPLPFIYKKKIKMKYAHIGSRNPFTIIIHGRKLYDIPCNYKRYLICFFRRSLNIFGFLITISFKENKNPYVYKINKNYK